MDQTLLEQITRAVLEELSTFSGDGAAAREAAPPIAETGEAKRILCLLVEGGREVDDTCRRLRAVPSRGLHWVRAVNDPQSLPWFRSLLGELPGEWLSSYPSSWESLVVGVDLVVIPFLPLPFIAKLANLITDEPALAAAAAALLAGKPVIAGAQEVNFLNLHSGRIPKGFLDVYQGHLKTISTLGLHPMDMRNLEAEIRRALSLESYGAAGKQVVTKEDIQAAFDGGRKTLEYGRGAIVTPLARDTAEQLGVELKPA